MIDFIAVPPFFTGEPSARARSPILLARIAFPGRRRLRRRRDPSADAEAWRCCVDTFHLHGSEEPFMGAR
jgi:hypothetical protein